MNRPAATPAQVSLGADRVIARILPVFPRIAQAEPRAASSTDCAATLPAELARESESGATVAQRMAAGRCIGASPRVELTSSASARPVGAVASGKRLGCVGAAKSLAFALAGPTGDHAQLSEASAEEVGILLTPPAG